MSAILTADVHMTENPREQFRWRLWRWLRRTIRARDIQNLFILGDLTESKDRHNAQLVNRLHRELDMLCSECSVWILVGNHDFIDVESPFFEFVGTLPNVNFIAGVCEETIDFAGDHQKCLFLPSPKDWEQEWQGYDFREYDYIFTHATFEGCLSENGTKMRGIPPAIFSRTKAKIWSGDIHVPQRIDRINYVGAPYHTRFGDEFEPRVVLIESDGSISNLHFPAPIKHVALIRSPADLDGHLKKLRPQDQMKVRVQLQRGDWPEWPSIRQEIIERVQLAEIVLVGPEPILIRQGQEKKAKSSRERIAPEQLIRDYGKSEGANAGLVKAGIELWEQIR